MTKMTANGVTTTNSPGQEQYEEFTAAGNKYIQYDYRHTDGELFSCVRETLDICRAKRDEWLAQKALSDYDIRSEAYTAAWQALNTLETARKTFVTDSKARIAALSQQIEAAKGKATLLQDSGCPKSSDVACALLIDAQRAERSLAALQDSLSNMRAADREECERIDADVEAARAVLDALVNPKDERASPNAGGGYSEQWCTKLEEIGNRAVSAVILLNALVATASDPLRLATAGDFPGAVETAREWIASIAADIKALLAITIKH
jgi:hypothetical protein